MAWEKKVATGQPQVGKNGKPLTPQEQAFNKRDAGQFTKLTFTRADNTSRDPIADPHLVVTLPNLGKVWISATPNGVTMQGEVDRGADGKANIQRRLSPDEIRAVRTAVSASLKQIDQGAWTDFKLKSGWGTPKPEQKAYLAELENIKGFLKQLE